MAWHMERIERTNQFNKNPQPKRQLINHPNSQIPWTNQSSHAYGLPERVVGRHTVDLVELLVRVQNLTGEKPEIVRRPRNIYSARIPHRLALVARFRSGELLCTAGSPKIGYFRDPLRV